MDETTREAFRELGRGCGHLLRLVLGLAWELSLLGFVILKMLTGWLVHVLELLFATFVLMALAYRVWN